MDRYKDVKKDTIYDYNINGATLMTTKIPDDIFQELKSLTLGEDISHHLLSLIHISEPTSLRRIE